MAGVMRVMTLGVCHVIKIVASYFTGGGQVVKMERLRPLIRYCDNNYAVHLGGSGDMLPQELWKFRLPKSVSLAF